MNQWSEFRAGRVARVCVLAAAVAIIGAGCADTGTPTGAPPAMVGTPVGGTGGPGMLPGMPGMGGAGNSVGVPVGGAMPCAVETVVKTGCQLCHGATPIAGAPMSLLSLADFTRDYTVKTTMQLRGQTMKMYQLAKIRLNREMGTTPMPQGTPLSMDAFGTLNGWLGGGAPAGTACSVGQGGMGGTAPPPMGGTGGSAGSVSMAGSGGDGGPRPIGPSTQCTNPGAFDPLVANQAEGETCWDFRTHGASGTTDTSKFSVPIDESYSQFYFEIPWPAGSVSTRFGSDLDNKQVLHHWLAFGSDASGLPAAGTVARNVTGTTLGENAELIAGWAVGGCSTTYPADVGVAVPDPAPNRRIMIQWHHYNSTGSPADDGSAVQICTVPEGTRPHKAGVTFLGTEAIFLGPGMGTATGECTNNSGAPITIIGFTPHMHTIGIRMTSVVDRAAGGPQEMPFDMPFTFDQQINYEMNPPYVLQPGDKITSTCTYMNENGGLVTFGQPTSSEMCYQFAIAYPYQALNNNTGSLIGATNICW